jgi:hypothetical protein
MWGRGCRVAEGPFNSGSENKLILWRIRLRPNPLLYSPFNLVRGTLEMKKKLISRQISIPSWNKKN